MTARRSPIPFGCGERAVRFARMLRHRSSSLPGRAFQLDFYFERMLRAIYGPRHPVDDLENEIMAGDTIVPTVFFASRRVATERRRTPPRRRCCTPSVPSACRAARRH